MLSFSFFVDINNLKKPSDSIKMPLWPSLSDLKSPILTRNFTYKRLALDLSFFFKQRRIYSSD